MQLAALDWAIVALYIAFALGAGVILSRRASQNVDEFFLSGRRLPWWIAGTSMIATSFAADTPLVVTGWVRDFGIWKNWLWWCYAAGGFLTVFLFARYWRRGEVMTTAELSELRYGGDGAKALRGFLGFYHSFIKNELVLSWVLLAALKIMDVLLGTERLTAIVLLCLVSLVYSSLAGLWGVVMTDVVQFVMALFGALFLGVVAWNAVGGIDGLTTTLGSELGPETLAMFPPAGEGNVFDASFWTTSVATVAVYLGLAWWATDNVDGGPIAVQRISACKDERQGVYSRILWFNVTHYALRPWPWILVALASLAILPTQEIVATVDGVVVSIDDDAQTIGLAPPGSKPGTPPTTVVSMLENDPEPHWRPIPTVDLEQEVKSGQVVGRTDSERAYPVMMALFLPTGLLGLMVASLVAAFMSTIDTHVNLASSFFVNDVYRRFQNPSASPKRLVLVARLASAGVLALGGIVAWHAESIRGLFEFFLTLMSGVGPVYLARWLWWRIKASSEITAMVASACATLALTYFTIEWPNTALTPNGELSAPARMCLVVAFSLVCTGVSMLVAPPPDPSSLVGFYRRVRPIGAWGPVRALAADVTPPRELSAVIAGVLGGLAATFGAMFGIGFALLGRGSHAIAAFCVAALGTAMTTWALKRLQPQDASPRGR